MAERSGVTMRPSGGLVKPDGGNGARRKKSGENPPLGFPRSPPARYNAFDAEYASVTILSLAVLAMSGCGLSSYNLKTFCTSLTFQARPSKPRDESGAASISTPAGVWLQRVVEGDVLGAAEGRGLSPRVLGVHNAALVARAR
jgi:hypothetical protein